MVSTDSISCPPSAGPAQQRGRPPREDEAAGMQDTGEDGHLGEDGGAAPEGA